MQISLGAFSMACNWWGGGGGGLLEILKHFQFHLNEEPFALLQSEANKWPWLYTTVDLHLSKTRKVTEPNKTDISTKK